MPPQLLDYPRVIAPERQSCFLDGIPANLFQYPLGFSKLAFQSAVIKFGPGDMVHAVGTNAHLRAIRYLPQLLFREITALTDSPHKHKKIRAKPALLQYRQGNLSVRCVAIIEGELHRHGVLCRYIKALLEAIGAYPIGFLAVFEATLAFAKPVKIENEGQCTQPFMRL